MRDEIAFNPDVAMEAATQADFTYKITPNTTTITDTALGELSVTKDIDAVLRKIEYWDQGLIVRFASIIGALKGLNILSNGTGMWRSPLILRFGRR